PAWSRSTTVTWRQTGQPRSLERRLRAITRRRRRRWSRCDELCSSCSVTHAKHVAVATLGLFVVPRADKLAEDLAAGEICILVGGRLGLAAKAPTTWWVASEVAKRAYGNTY